MANTNNNHTAELAVRQYLMFLDDPKKLRDDKDIEKKERALAAATDPITKLKAIAALAAAKNVDGDPLREAFIANAQAWGKANGVPVDAFAEMGVPADVLSRAGFSVALASKRGATRQRKESVPTEDIKTWILKQAGKKFILTDVIEGVGGSPATVRKAVDELIADEKVVKEGPMPSYEGRGRAPIEYSVV